MTIALTRLFGGFSNAACLPLALLVLASMPACGDPAPKPRPDAAVVDVTADAAGSDAAATDVVAADLVADAVGADVPGSDAAVTETVQGCPSGCVDSDNNPCTYSVCEAGSCVSKFAADGSSCEDGDPCTAADACVSGSCTPSTEPSNNLCGCSTQADCADFEDSLVCNGSLYCDTSVFPYSCKVNPATIPPCEDQAPPSPCLVAACLEPGSPGTKPQCAWLPAANGKPCDDANPLTEGDVCFQGSCQPGFFVGSCQKTSDCQALEDGNLCNGQLFCNVAAGKCQLNPASIVVCKTVWDTTCKKNTCQPATGQCLPQATAEGVACDDGNSCTTGDVCDEGKCGAGASSHAPRNLAQLPDLGSPSI
jgi:hypothetical protein